MLSDSERERIERLEHLVSTLMGGGAPLILGGDVIGPAGANALVNVLALAGSGNRVLGVNNAGLVVPVNTGTLPLAGDVTGTLSASVLSKIAALAGSGTRLVEIDNLGNVLAAAPGTLALAGDVTGSLSASVLSKIAALAGSGTRIVEIDNAGNVLAVTPGSLAIAGDVTGTLAAAVLAKIASLAGGGNRLVAVDNTGAIISAGTPIGIDPFQYIGTVTANTIAPSSATNFDFDLSSFLNSEIRMRARCYATTKDTGGVPGANMTGAAYVVSDGVYENRNTGVITFGTAAAGGAANPMPAVNNEMTVEPQTCAAALQSGGGAPPNLAWTVSGALARLVYSSTNNANHGSVQIDIYRRVATAP